MREITLQEMQQIELNMFKVFVQVCQQYNLRYFMDGGTLLGACWFKGFIPWDDDIDLKMPRPDYEKLISLDNAFPDYISIEKPSEGKCEYLFAKLIDNRTVLIEEKNGIKKFTGIYIDIFPMDGYPDESRMYEKHRKKMQKLNGLFHSSLEGFSALKRSKQIRSRIRGHYYAMRFKSNQQAAWYFCQILHREAQKYPYDTSKCVGMTVEGDYEKEKFQREWVDEIVQLPFEDGFYNAPGGYDPHLTIFYGDYMHLPKILPDHYHTVYWKDTMEIKE